MRTGTPRHRILLARNTFANAGDEAMLTCELARLRERFASSEITLITDDPEEARRRHRVDARPSEIVLGHPVGTGAVQTVRDALTADGGPSPLARAAKRLLIGPVSRAYLSWSCRRFVRSARSFGAGREPGRLPDHHRSLLTTLAKADVLLGGGGLLPSLPNLFMTRSALYRAADLLDVPVVLHGQSIPADPRTATVLRRASRIVLRDDSVSRRNALELGVRPEKLLLGTDPADGLEPAAWNDVRSRIDSREPAPTPGGYLAVNVRDWKGRNLAAGIRAVASALRDFAGGDRNGRVPIVLFGMQAYHDDDDRRALTALASHFGSEVRHRFLRGGTDPRIVKGLVGHARLVVSCRYHGALFAMEQGVPAIALSVGPEYDVKLGGLFRRYGMEEHHGSLLEADAGRLAERLERVDGERHAIAERLRARASELAGLRGVGFDAVEAALDRGMNEEREETDDG